MTFSILASSNPLHHVIQHAIKTTPVDLESKWGIFGWVLAPKGEITILSDQITMIVAAGILLTLLFPMLVGKRKGSDDINRMVPTGFANFLETICQYLRKEVAEPALQAHTDRFIKYIWSVFFFVLTMNLLGLLPLPAISALFGTHIGGAATGNIYTTATLSLMTMMMMVVNGLRLGGKHYIAHFCPGPLWLAPLLVPVEIIGLFAKIFALSVRLFANMMAGHILLAVLVGFILSAWGSMGSAGGLIIAVPVVLASVAITLLELFVAFLQAYIFTFLTTLFIGMCVVFHHDDHDESHATAH